MPSSVIFGTSTIWEDGAEGAGMSFVPASTQLRMIEKEPPLGIGYWLKPGNIDKATHSMPIAWITGAGLDSIKLASRQFNWRAPWLRCPLLDGGLSTTAAWRK